MPKPIHQPEVDRTAFTVAVDGQPVEVYARLETAIRAFGAITTASGTFTGTIGVTTVRDGLMVRDGNILRVTKDRTYLNPNLTLA